MKKLTEEENKKLEEYIVKTVHDDGHIEINIDIKRMIDDLLGINVEGEEKEDTVFNKIIKVTYVKQNGKNEFGRHIETSLYLVNKTKDEIQDIFKRILQIERGGDDPASNVNMSIRAYVMTEGQPYEEEPDNFNNLIKIKGAELIDGRSRRI